jgi:MFS family permease
LFFIEGRVLSSADTLPPPDSVAPARAADDFFGRVRTTTRALKHRNFRLFISGQLLSVIGTWVQSFAQSWLVYRLTGSSVMLGLVGFATQFPYLFSPVGGVLADRFNRRNLLILTQAFMALQAVLLAWLTLSGRINPWMVFYLALGLGVIGLFELTARQSFVVEMVGKEDLMNAIALNSSMYNMGRVVGPAIAGILVPWIGEGWCFAVNAISFVAVIVGLVMMRLPSSPPRAELASPVVQFREGAKYVARSKPTKALLLNLGLLSIFNYPAIVLMPVFADRILGGGPRTLGILMTCFGGGALVGALLMASRTGLAGLSSRIVRATLVYSLALVVFSMVSWLPLAAVLIAITGGGIMTQIASTNTALQTITPDHLRGRVVGYYGMMFLGMVPIGSLMAGWLGDWIGVRWTVGLTAAVCVIAALLFERRRAVVVDALRQLHRA